MRDSAFKRFCISGYFSAREVLAAVRGMLNAPEFSVQNTNYDEYWQNRAPGGIHPRFEIIGKHLQSGESVLDVGCGDGAMLEYFAAARAVQCLGLDISAVAVERARARGVDARAQDLGEFCKEVGPVTFDHVVISEVLEHVVESEKIIGQGWKLAGKTMWLTFPNIAYFPHRLRLLAGRFPVQWVVFPSEHVRFWSVHDFKWWLRQLGMAEPRMYASNGLTIFGVHRIWPNLLANQIVVQLNKK
jgi:methionine biosynthesis protein MetW